MNGYLKDAGDEISCDDFLKLQIVKDLLYIPKDFQIKKSIDDKDSKYIHFFHQDFRDYFCARFLIGLLDLSKEEITQTFKNKLPNDVLLLMSEIIGEYRYMPDFNNNQENDSRVQRTLRKFEGKLTSDEAIAVSQLIEVVRLGRNDELGMFDFDLFGVNKTILINAGIDVNNISTIDLCTCSREDLFHSYRRGPVDDNGIHLNGMNGMFLKLL